MQQVFAYSLNAVMPILLLILCGYIGQRAGYLSEKTITEINKYNFRFGFFSMLFVNIYNVDVHKALPLMLMALTMGILVLLTLIGWGASAFLTKEKYRRGILTQAAFRSNYAVIGTMLAETLAGPEAVSLVAMFQLPAVLYFNVMSVLVMSIYSDSEEKPSPVDVLIKMVKNPIIQGILAGTVCLVIRMHLPAGSDGEPIFTLRNNLPWIMTAFTYLSRMCSPLALIVLGASLKIEQTKALKKELISGVVMRLVMAPVIGFGILIAAADSGLLVLTPVESAVMVSLFGSPLATSTAIMAREMGADKDLAAQLVVWTSVLSMLTLFVIVAMLRRMGLL